MPFWLAVLIASPTFGAVIGPAKKPYADRDDDVARAHVEEVRGQPHAYEVAFRGTVDGTMTRMPVGYAAFEQVWQPNRSVLIENVGRNDVRNPWLVVNGKRNWRTLKTIVAEATRGYTAPADRARAIWESQRRRRFHACTWDAECNDAIKVLNVYGYTLCGNEARVLGDLWKAAGFTTRRGYPIGHVVGEVHYDGAFHLMDSDEHVICLKRDNRTIASAADVVRDHDLVKRTHTYGIGRRDERRNDEFSASLYVHDGERKGDFGTGTHHSMDLVLRPGESIEFRWSHVGKQYTAGTARKKGQKSRDGLGELLDHWGPTAYDNMRNGMLRYRPDLSGPLAQQGTAAVDNTAFDTAVAAIKPVDPHKPATVTWRFAGPYVFVGGKASATVKLGSDAFAQWRYSTDGKKWNGIASVAEAGSAKHLAASLDDVVSPRGQPTYAFRLQLELRGDSEASDVTFEHDIQTSLLSLPELEVGTNKVAYTDANQDGRQVRITHRWLERTAWHPPQPPGDAVAPKDGETVEGTRVGFQWKAATDPDGDAIVDYHFELSEHADMRWPLSPNFEKRISLTPSKDTPSWTVPYVGLLNPDTTYHWRVRALDATGVWGSWSRRFRFRVEAPGVPLDLKLTPEGDYGWTLTWKPNPQGRAPVAYKVYGSDEKGFTASDSTHRVYRGRGRVRSIDDYNGKPSNAPDAGLVEMPRNLIARVTETRMQVVGPELTQPNTNQAHYRVVAIDSAGNESGPSDYADVPRPFVFTKPNTQAIVGEPYRYEPRVIRSIGDLRCRRSPKSSYNAAFWDGEEHTFASVRLPEGISLDTSTGVISGRPKQAGTLDVVFKVSDQFGKSRTVAYRLSVKRPS